MALKKNGVELIDPTEMGAHLFNHYGEFDNSVDGNSLNAINGIMAQIEHQADIIAGTSPQMLGDISERDAVGNVKMGIKRSLMINQPLFELFRGNQNRIMRDLVRVAQLSYKNGKRISYIVGGESYVFDIVPDKFSFTDYAITIQYASKETARVEQMRALGKELITAGVVDPDVMVKIMLSDSITEISQLITKNWFKKKMENDQLGQMSGQIEQYEKQLKELSGQLSNITQQLEASKAANNATKLKEVEYNHAEELKKLSLEEEKILNQKEFNEMTIKLKEATVQLEREQLYMGIGNSKEIRNI
jgi:hypothetical protein